MLHLQVRLVFYQLKLIGIIRVEHKPKLYLESLFHWYLKSPVSRLCFFSDQIKLKHICQTHAKIIATDHISKNRFFGV